MKPAIITIAMLACILLGASLQYMLGSYLPPEPGASVARAEAPAYKLYTFANLLDAMEYVESKGKADAVGDGGAAVGSFQIHKIYVDDVNRIIAKRGLRTPDFTYDDRLDPFKSRIMVTIYTEEYTDIRAGQIFQNTFKIERFEKAARNHNGGPWGWRKESTIAYWELVRARLESQ